MQQHPRCLLGLVNKANQLPTKKEYEYMLDPQAYQKAHPDPERETVSDELLQEVLAKEDEWGFLYEDEDEDDENMPNGALFPSEQRRGLSQPAMPIQKPATPGPAGTIRCRYATRMGKSFGM